MNNKEKQLLRDLAEKVVEIANYPVQAEKADLWARLNGLESRKECL